MVTVFDGEDSIVLDHLVGQEHDFFLSDGFVIADFEVAVLSHNIGHPGKTGFSQPLTTDRGVVFLSLGNIVERESAISGSWWGIAGKK